MAITKLFNLLFIFLLAAYITQGSRLEVVLPNGEASESFTWHEESNWQGAEDRGVMSSRRSMIGSTAPVCTYNECRGCKYKCRAEQVPVEGNDPMNSPYHYRCVCHG